MWPVVGQAHHRDSQRLNCCSSLLLAMTAGGSHPSAAMVSWFRTIMLPRNPNVLRVVHWKHLKSHWVSNFGRPFERGVQRQPKQGLPGLPLTSLNHRFWMVLVHLLQRVLWAISWRPFYLGKSSPFFSRRAKKIKQVYPFGFGLCIHTYINTYIHTLPPSQDPPFQIGITPPKKPYARNV